MRREEISQESYVDWLKSLGCVFYAPLGQGDWKDYISGIQGTLEYNNTCVWDSNQNAYLLTKDSSYNPVQSIMSFNDVYMNMTGNADITFLMNFNSVRYGSNQYGSEDSGSILNCRTTGVIYLALQQSSFGVVNRNTWYNWAVTWYSDGTHRYLEIYRNGTRNYYQDRGVESINIQPSDVKDVLVNQCFYGNRRFTGAKFYARNIMWFNKRLTQEQIMQVQNIS